MPPFHTLRHEVQPDVQGQPDRAHPGGGGAERSSSRGERGLRWQPLWQHWRWLCSAAVARLPLVSSNYILQRPPLLKKGKLFFSEFCVF